MGQIFRAIGRGLGFKFTVMFGMMLVGFTAYPLGNYLGTMLGMSEDGKMWIMLAFFFAILIGAALIWERIQWRRFYGN